MNRRTTLAARGKAEAITAGSAGNGSPGHLASEVFGAHTGAMTLHVPDEGHAPAVMALLPGEVQAGLLATPGLLPHLQSGKVRALATPSTRRSPVLPQVASLDMVPNVESGPAAARRLEGLAARYARVVKATGMKAD